MTLLVILVKEPVCRGGREHGAWSMEHGAWSMEHGARSMEHGARGMLGAQLLIPQNVRAWSRKKVQGLDSEKFKRVGVTPDRHFGPVLFKVIH